MSERPLSFVTIRRQFDFKSIEVGRWVTEQERDRAAIRFYKALMDLMVILQGSEVLISLRGTLGLQYGIGGRPSIAAHYIPATRQLALAKNAGAGSLAHEWFHALDHYLADKCFRNTSPMAFASSCWIKNHPIIPHPINDLLANCFKTILLDESGKQPSQLFEHSAATDKQLGVLYYSQPEELCARAFEAFVEDSGVANSFLVKGTRHSKEARAGLYPQGKQRKQINQAFLAYFSTLGAALSARHND